MVGTSEDQATTMQGAGGASPSAPRTKAGRTVTNHQSHRHHAVSISRCFSEGGQPTFGPIPALKLFSTKWQLSGNAIPVANVAKWGGSCRIDRSHQNARLLPMISCKRAGCFRPNSRWSEMPPPSGHLRLMRLHSIAESGLASLHASIAVLAIFCSRGSQYVSIKSAERLGEAGIEPSAKSRVLKPRKTITPCWTKPTWQRNLTQIVSCIPGAVQT